MVSGILGKKVGMTQLFDDRGEIRPITVLQAGPCVITQRKNSARDGYDAVQIGLIEFVKGKRVTKGMQGHFAKHNLPPVKFMKEVAVTTPAEAGEKQAKGENPAAETNGQVKVGDKVLVDIF
ncbi:MAG TPA: hypothetical protein VJT08_02780, partial [Terriglobales bacterium]|nr:hypothetical protein [Terriglobales bacterium]